MTTERWKPIAGFEGYYSVSSHGRVRSEARHVQRSDGKTQFVRQRFMSPAKKEKGHLSVMLYGAEKKRVRKHIHRLVLFAFRGPPPTPLHDGAHNDGNPGNNHVNNLRWATCSENLMDKVAHGTHNRGERHPLCTIPDETVRRIRASTKTMKQIAADLGMDYRYVWAIKTERVRRWS